MSNIVDNSEPLPVAVPDVVPISTSGIPTPTNLPPGIPAAPPLQGGAFPYEGKNVNVPVYITLWDIRRIIEETMDKKFREWERSMKENP